MDNSSATCCYYWMDNNKHTWLVVSTPLKKYESQWEGLSLILWKIKTCLKPPTRYRNNVKKHQTNPRTSNGNPTYLSRFPTDLCYPVLFPTIPRFSERRATADTNSKSRHCHRGSSLLEILGRVPLLHRSEMCIFWGGNRTLRRPN